VCGDARVCGDAQVCGGALVSGNARVFGNAQVFGGKWKVSPLFILGTKHSVCVCKPGVIRIGCEEHSIDEWLENYRAIGEKNKYSSNEIEEYGLHIKYVDSLKRLPSVKGN